VPTIKSTNNRAKADDMRRKIDKSTQAAAAQERNYTFIILSSLSLSLSAIC
jgi:hypothetical protein